MANGELKDQNTATAAQVRAAETLFAIATGTEQIEYLKVPQSVMREVYGEAATQDNLYDIIKAIIVGGTDDDTAKTITITQGGGTFTPTKQNLFTAVAAILQASTNVTITQDGTNYELDIAATQRGAPTEEEVFDQVKNIITAGGNITVTDDDAANTITIAATQQRTSSTHSNLGTSDTSILTNVGDNDRIEIYYKETAGSNYYTDSWTFRFGDLDSNLTRRVISASGNNFSILYKKSGTTLQMRQGGGLNASNFMRLTRYPNYYA